MTAQQIERLKVFVEGHRHRSRVTALNCKEGGYLQLAAEHTNEAILAEIILRDLEDEHARI